MELIDSDKIDILSFGDSDISVLKDSTMIFSTKIPAFDITATTVKESIVENEHSFEDEQETSYKLHISSSLNGVEYQLLCDDLIDDAVVVQIVEMGDSIPSSTSNVIATYVPLVKYTNRTIDLLSCIIPQANKQILPLIDIRKEKQIVKYEKDNFYFPHILDLCDLHTVANHQEREDIKLLRKTNKTNPPEIPDEIEIRSTPESIISQYIRLKNKILFMPVCRIDTEESPTLEFGKYADALLENFDKITLRVMGTNNFENNIQSYLMKFSKILHCSCIIIEFNGIKPNREREIIEYVSNLDTDIQIIYAKETTNYKEHSITINHLNIFPNTSLSGYYDRLQDSDSSLWYADYCGYDRDTATEFVIGMKPNASLYLIANDDAMDIIILKVKHPTERGTAKWTLSAQMLINNYVKTGLVNSRFLDATHCNSCNTILRTSSLTLASAKYLSMLHNATTLAVL
ncbi:hypothetical protein [Sulfurimonas autotrophica]|uniref:Uncharacterized protein n=1 Tax=Sulfurimonas autotrophica (strain ATCC BAA-671 / DSM 16294 / JCM 11897 / OK10) TaxID=563040 RepID=E0UTA2_SULAO|nr:hypothetical protein [Sulfurimonas autotrophica]ADN08205.1 hypothetical protein Saut_0156 [Sulfurimonas autotrophica DSM 16294]